MISGKLPLDDALTLWWRRAFPDHDPPARSLQPRTTWMHNMAVTALDWIPAKEQAKPLAQEPLQAQNGQT
jgi:hypothetical protein